MYGVQVRGATDPHAEAYAVLFGDFLGLSMTLQRLNGDITGTYMSCSPLDEHFAILGKQTPPTHDMKFGQNPDGRPLYTYSSTKHQEDLLGKVATWFHEKAATVKASMVFGKRMMSISDLQQLFHLFGKKAQLNIFASHCFTGSLVPEIASEPLQARQTVRPRQKAPSA